MTKRLTPSDYEAFADLIQLIEIQFAHLMGHPILSTKRNFDLAEKRRQIEGDLQSLEMLTANRGAEIEAETKARLKKLKANKKAKADLGIG